MKRKIVVTKDGSTSIYLPELDEHYHSSHGAIQEALHVFIENGLKSFNPGSELVIFELGFGTGLNALLTLIHGDQYSINYLGLEAYPVEMEDVRSLNYIDLLGGFKQEFDKMHLGGWNCELEISSNFKLTKIHAKIEDYEPASDSVDLIYFDAFGHRAQEEMWDISILTKMSEMLRKGGVLVTYAARGQLKRDLLSLGFNVQKLPGPPGKREMTKATKL